MHTPGAQIDKIMHPAIFLYIHFYIKVSIILNIHAHAGCTGKCAHREQGAPLISNTGSRRSSAKRSGVCTKG